jgi:hypothetical protein
MKATDIQLMLVIRGLYREGHRMMTIRQIMKRCEQERQNWWHKRHDDAVEARQGMNTRPNHSVWRWSDRFQRAITRLAKTGRIKVEGKKGKLGYLCDSKVYLWDYTIKQMFGDQAFQFVVQHSV